MPFSDESLRIGLESQGVDVLSTGVDGAAGVAYAMVTVGTIDQRFETNSVSDLLQACTDLTLKVAAQEDAPRPGLPASIRT